MNNFEKTFFRKYIPEGSEIKYVIHKHFLEIFGKILVWLSLAIIPSFLYYHSISIKVLVPFYILEVFLYIIYIKVIYDIFDWYNDVWIITDKAIVALEWSLFSVDNDSLLFENIEGMGAEQDGFLNTIIDRGNLIIHRIGTDSFRFENVSKPNDMIAKIEEISSYSMESDFEPNITEERFNMIMGTLGGVVENYLEKEGLTEEDIIKKEEKLKEIERNDGTIDLR